MLTHPNDGQRVLDKEVENECDDTDEGQDGHPDILPRLRRIQLILSDIPKVFCVKYSLKSNNIIPTQYHL